MTVTDNIAILDGFTEELWTRSSEVDLYLLVRPSTDLDGTFKAWDMDEQEYIHVNGWLFEFEQPIPRMEVER